MRRDGARCPSAPCSRQTTTSNFLITSLIYRWPITRRRKDAAFTVAVCEFTWQRQHDKQAHWYIGQDQTSHPSADVSNCHIPEDITRNVHYTQAGLYNFMYGYNYCYNNTTLCPNKMSNFAIFIIFYNDIKSTAMKFGTHTHTHTHYPDTVTRLLIRCVGFPTHSYLFSYTTWECSWHPRNYTVLLSHMCVTLKTGETRSTGTVHTSAKARLTNVAIRIRIRDPDHHQNLTVCSLASCQPSLKISCKSVHVFAQSC